MCTHSQITAPSKETEQQNSLLVQTIHVIWSLDLCSSAEIHKQAELTAYAALSSLWMGISDTGSKIKVKLLNLCILLPDLQSW